MKISKIISRPLRTKALSKTISFLGLAVASTSIVTGSKPNLACAQAQRTQKHTATELAQFLAQASNSKFLENLSDLTALSWKKEAIPESREEQGKLYGNEDRYVEGLRRAIEKNYIRNGDLVLDISGHGISNCLELMQQLSANCTFHYPHQLTSSIDGERLLAQAQSFGLTIAGLASRQTNSRTHFLAFDSHQLSDKTSQANFLKEQSLPNAQELKTQGIQQISITLEHPHAGLRYLQPEILTKEFIERASRDEGAARHFKTFNQIYQKALEWGQAGISVKLIYTDGRSQQQPPSS